MTFLKSFKRFLTTPACGCKKTKKNKRRAAQRGGYNYSSPTLSLHKKYSKKSTKRFHRKSSKTPSSMS